jgi:putative transposase
MSRTPYPTDLTDRQWRLIEPYVPRPKPGGRPARYERRDVVDAIFYQTRNGCTWRALPHDLPPYRIVFHYFRAWQADGTWDRIHDALRAKVRRAVGKKPKPSVAIVDGQTVKGTEHSAPNGYDGGKKDGGPQAVHRGRHPGADLGVDGRAGRPPGSRRRAAADGPAA